MKRYFLVDMENVHVSGLLGMGSLTENDVVILFMSKHCKQDVDMIELYKDICKCNILTIYVGCGGKNELDFQLISYLGLLIGENKNQGEYYIVSKDKGYNSSINLLSNSCKSSIKLIKSIGSINSHTNDTNLEIMYNHLSKQFSKKQTVIDIIKIIMAASSKYDAMDKIEAKYTPENTLKCEDALNIFFGEDDLNTKDLEVLKHLNQSIKRKSLCYEVLNIMKLTTDIGLVLDIIESTLKGFNILRDRIQESLYIYYGQC